MRNEAVRHKLFLSTTIVFFAIFGYIFEVETNTNAAELNLRARMKRHRCSVVVHAGNVRTINADAGICAAEGERGLFGELETAGISRRAEGRSYGQGCRSDLEGRVIHERLLKNFIK